MRILGRHKKVIDKDFLEIVSAEFISVTGGVLAGVLLTLLTGKIELIPALLILLPGFLEMRGNISGSLAARLGASLHLKKIRTNLKSNKLLNENVIASIILAIIVSIALGIIAYLITYFIFDINNTNIIFIALIASILSTIIEIPLTVITTFWLFKHKYDPDDIMGPYVTTIGDVVSVISLIIAAALLI